MGADGPSALRRDAGFQVVTGLTLLLAACEPPQPSPAAQPGTFAFATTIADAGVRVDGEEISVEFPFVNASRETVHVADLLASCSCAELKVDLGGEAIDFSSSATARPFDVRPGGCGSVRARQVARATEEGKKSSSVRVLFGSGQRDPMLLQWSAHVRPRYTVEPREIVVREAAWGRPASFSAKVRRVAASALTVTGHSPLPPGWGIEIAPALDGVEIRGTCDPAVVRPRFRAVVELHTTTLGDIRVPVAIEPVPLLRIEPGKLITLSSEQLRDAGEVEVKIEAIDGRTLRCIGVDEVECNLAEGLAAWELPLEGGRTLRLRGRLKTVSARGPVRAWYRIRLDHPYEDAVDLRFYGFAPLR